MNKGMNKGMKIFYFSGTGNSFIVAKEIAEKLKAELISIPQVMNADKILVDDESMVIVFPSYLSAVVGIPLIIERFVKKIADIRSHRIFAVCTCGGYESFNALLSLKKLNKVIRSCGGRLYGEYSVRLPMNNLEYDHIPIPINRDQDVIISRSKIKIDYICRRLTNKRGTRFRAAKALLNLIMAPFCILLRKPVTKTMIEKAKEPPETKLKCAELMPLTDKSIIVDDKCTGCGTCSQVCPVNNIKITGGRPEFQHRCEMCFACDEWCPSNAIRHWSRAVGVKYHHPEAAAIPGPAAKP